MKVDKNKIINELMPRAVLKCMNSKAKRAVPEDKRHNDLVPIHHFPFKIGRESRIGGIEGEFEILERRKSSYTPSSNDLYLADDSELLNVSRQHLTIDESGSGFIVIDRGSACGTIVQGKSIGGKDRGGNCPLKDGDLIVIGIEGSPYQYQFIVLDMVAS
jgi:hypothetical protein